MDLPSQSLRLPAFCARHNPCTRRETSGQSRFKRRR